MTPTEIIMTIAGLGWLVFGIVCWLRMKAADERNEAHLEETRRRLQAACDNWDLGEDRREPQLPQPPARQKRHLHLVK